MKKETEKEIPEGVKILSVVAFVCTAIFFIFGIISFKFGENMGDLSDAEKSLISQQGIPTPSTPTFVIVGIVLIVLSVVFYFIGRDLLKSKKWAKIALIVISALLILLNILSLISGSWSPIIMILVNGLVVWYLAYSKPAKNFF